MIKLIFKNGTQEDRLHKLRLLDNLRDFVEEKSLQGIVFSYEAIAALSVFPVSHCSTIFSIIDNKIVKSIYKIKNPISQNWGYSYAEFHISRDYDLSQYQGEELIEKTEEKLEKQDWIYYIIHNIELEKIGWTDAANIPDFVTEVFTKLDCMPDEIINE